LLYASIHCLDQFAHMHAEDHLGSAEQNGMQAKQVVDAHSITTIANIMDSGLPRIIIHASLTGLQSRLAATICDRPMTMAQVWLVTFC